MFIYAGEGEVYTWGWSECVPSIKPTVEDGEQVKGPEHTTSIIPTSSQNLSPLKDALLTATAASPIASHLVPRPGGSSKPSTLGRPPSTRSPFCMTSECSRGGGSEENVKKRKVVSFEDKQSPDSPSNEAEENVFAPPCLVNLNPGIKIKTVAAGGRHTLALSGNLIL